MITDRQSFRFEVCANGVESCLAAREGGADRVELCAALEVGGLTPSYATLAGARKVEGLGLHVLIRPRSGDFNYTAAEVDIMADDIRMAARVGADGVVLGCLTPEGDIDVEAVRRLKEAAGGCSVTFHRAFDCCRNASSALEQLVDLGVDRILTSGQRATAEEGIPLLRELNLQAAGRIRILAGSGVNAGNIAKLYRETGIREYHFSAKRKLATRMTYFNRSVYMGTPGGDDYGYECTSAEAVRLTIEALAR
jgi:copper homeostasis protein